MKCIDLSSYLLDTAYKKVRSEKLTQIVLHWTGGPTKRDVRKVADVLKERGLSCHFIIGSRGEVGQMVSESSVAYHAGVANQRSIGIEITGSGPAFNTAQVASVLTLVDSLCWEFGINKSVFIGEPGSYRESFSGVLGHYHVTNQKRDPGNLIWGAFIAAGYVPVTT